MEFFRIIPVVTTEKEIQDRITPNSVELYTETMAFISDRGADFRSHTIFGEFTLSYDRIKGGVRFSLLDCPNALTMTITTGFPPARDQVVLHCTINRHCKQQEFLDDLEEFMDEWAAGIQREF
jgi:hypothetical protein